MPRLFFGYLPDTLILFPTVVLSLGRCPNSGKVMGAQIVLSWLNMETGFEIDFFA